ncbi:hypothetical protein F7725_005625 [Dissostichus mawsoni]|uniref:Uncharacterized protein n=1 Tax=Dissostichus mawsoni TaxID=36200 RepID=A0A7J5YS83_DISMA|nr:hypothetical protein F7725_005625 [Dissostichus mawsoni]
MDKGPEEKNKVGRERQAERQVGTEKRKGDGERWSSEDTVQAADGNREGRGQGSVHSLSCCLIGRGSVRRADMNLIRDVRHQLQFKANSQADTAGEGTLSLVLPPPLCIKKYDLFIECVWAVPDPAPTKPSPGPPHHFHPASPTLPLSSSSSSSGNGKRASSSSQLQTQTPPQQQCQLSSASARYPPREVPPRFRQQEHKQLLKRGQPLPAGALSALTLSSSSSSSPSSSYSSSSSTTTGSTSPNSATSAASKRHPADRDPLSPLPPCITPTIPVSPADWGPLSSRQPAAVQTDSPVADISLQSGCIAQYETSHWGASLPVDSCSSANSWDKVNIDKSDTEAWPSINHSSDTSHTAAQECTLGSASSNTDNSAVTTTSSCRNLSMATGAAGQPAHYPSLKANNNMMTGPGSANTCGSRGWGADGKQDGMNGGRVGMPNNWGVPNFNMNLNPNANPSAWPVLGQEAGGGCGIGPNAVSNSPSLPPGINGNGNMGDGRLGGAENGGGGWGGLISANEHDQQHPSANANMSYKMEPSNLNTDGPNHTKQQQQQQQQAQEPMSPIHG